MSLATITSKGQVTIPKEIRESLKLHAGDKIEIQVTENGEAIISLPALQNFILSAPKHKCDLSDVLIGQSAHSHNCASVLTFDKQAAKFTLFELVK